MQTFLRFLLVALFCSLRYGLVVTQSNCSCGFGKQGNVGNVNGFPMMAALLDLQSYKIKCGGVIIDKRYVLTAAHCLGGQTPSTLAVAVGENDVNTPFNTSAAAFHRIEQFIIHPLYSSLNYDYDIALLRLNKSLEFSHRVGPVCLPFKFKNTTMPGSNLTILGWGTQDVSGGPTFNVLRKVYGHMIEQDACRVNVPSLTNTQFCTNTPGDDACQFGFGGPLLYADKETGAFFNIGIFSSGHVCANNDQPGVNTRVPPLLDWIVVNSPDADYCPLQ
ncbi:unnamed protein product [Chilo suppressalis]|uniref:Peptidase S1 domain-containing protein n=1 Tax=Chilo suppressalis TaxID=168631 RepID=A0ABN8BA32_CHISP|nr:unnamed protein product [Chilo suppressalis]